MHTWDQQQRSGIQAGHHRGNVELLVKEMFWLLEMASTGRQSMTSPGILIRKMKFFLCWWNSSVVETLHGAGIYRSLGNFEPGASAGWGQLIWRAGNKK